MITFLTSLFGPNVVKYLVIAGLLMALIGAIGGGYVYWKNNIQQQSLTNFNNEQLKATIKQQADYIVTLEALSAKLKKDMDDLAAQNNDLNKQIADALQYLNSPDVIKTDKTSSEILKNTIRALEKIK